jgi:hypothetical protein
VAVRSHDQGDIGSARADEFVDATLERIASRSAA